METSIYRYVIRHSLRAQILLTMLAVASFPFLYAFYEVPKQIVNRVIQGDAGDFPAVILGVSLSQLQYLFILCGAFLLLVVANQAFKYAINVLAGRTGERMLRRLRYDLYSRVLRFPLPHFRKLSQGEIITMVTAEVEPLGGFIGDSFKLPIFQGGYLLVILAFLLVQNWVMAAAAVALYPLQFYVVPKLQRRVNTFAKERVRLVRRLSDRIGETVSGVQEIHGNDTSAFERAGMSAALGEIYAVRLRIFIWKFVIKFLNNSINHLGPFCFYSIGGYFVIQGRLEIGTLMAAIAAHKDLAAPWKELLNYYQRREDARIKYEQVVSQFNPPGMLDESLQLGPPPAGARVEGELAASGLTLRDDTGTSFLEGVSLTLPADARVAVVGAPGSGREELALVLARLMNPTSGALTIGGERADRLHEGVTGRRLAFVGPQAFLFNATVLDNLLYGLKHEPASDARPDPHWAAEAEAAGNSTDDVTGDWIDREALGGEPLPRLLEVLEAVELDGDVFELGLRGTVDAEGDLRVRLLRARRAFRDRVADPSLAALVESFDAGRYNDNATVGENLLFGTPVGDGFDMERLAENPWVMEVLEAEGLVPRLLEAGRTVAATMLELFSDLPAGHSAFERFSFIDADDLPELQAVLDRAAQDGVDRLGEEDRGRLLSLPFLLQPARHRLGVVDDDLRARLLAARRRFAASIPEALRGRIQFFEADGYNAAASIQDNILFGKVAYGQARAAERVKALVTEVIDELDLRSAVIEAGLAFQVGIGGARLGAVPRQKVGLARALLKRPDVLVLCDATAGLDGATHARIAGNLFGELAGRGVVWSLHRADLARPFDRVVVMRSGRVAESGSFEELDREGSALHELLGAG